MNKHPLRYDGERLVPHDSSLKNLLTEDLAKFEFASRYAADKVVLDAGCGAGQGTAHVARKGARHVIGVDISREAVAYAYHHYVERAKLSNVSFGTINGMRLGFCGQAFDLVTSIEVIEHLVEPETYLTEIRRVLKDNGQLVLSTPNKRISSPTPGAMWPHHVHEFYPEELQSLLEHHFATVEMWGMSIPVYDQHPLRRLVHWFAPLFKPWLPLELRTRFLPTVQRMIKSELELGDVSFTQNEVAKKPTLIAVCGG
ncbi:MAG: methyltransferase domain-containing protein [Chloroflexota bacterium]|nr:methyltransferase domain-containing protein [Chloroflexota bacterium]